MKKRDRRQSQPKTRSRIAREAWFQTGGGTHGGNPRQQNKRDRKSSKIDLRRNAHG